MQLDRFYIKGLDFEGSTYTLVINFYYGIVKFFETICKNVKKRENFIEFYYLASGYCNK
jgi:hypothetical protein